MFRYYSSMLVLTVFLLGAIGSICAYKYWWLHDLHDDPSLGQILKFQEAKIDQLTPGQIDTVLIGDSSLGNAIDASILSSELGLKAINVALTGSFAYAGGLALLDRIERRTPIKNVIFFFTVDAMARTNYEGYFFAGGSLVHLQAPVQTHYDLSKLYLSRLLDAKAALRFAIARNDPVITERMRQDDYLVSSAKINLESELITAFRSPVDVNGQAVIFLKALDLKCERQKWNCIYLHGTMVKRLAETPAVERFTDLANAAIRSSTHAIKLVSTESLKVPDGDRGDTIYHVNWQLRSQYTPAVAAMLAPYMRHSSK